MQIIDYLQLRPKESKMCFVVDIFISKDLFHVFFLPDHKNSSQPWGVAGANLYRVPLCIHKDD